MVNHIDDRRWFILGRYPDGDVDIEDSSGVVIEKMPANLATRVVAAQNISLDKIETDYLRLMSKRDP